MLAAVVVVAALVVVLLGSRAGAGGGGATVSVSGGPVGSSPAPTGPTGQTGPSSSPSAALVVVHVVGAVQRPGVVSLGAGSRVSAAIDRAGGATPEADLARLNLARVVVDGERLYVPKVGETEVPAALGDGAVVAGPGGAGTGSDGGDAVVDLNSADQTTLETLPGIGPSLAGRILAWREEHGRFGSVEDLLDVSGIGDGRFADLRDRVRV